MKKIILLLSIVVLTACSEKMDVEKVKQEIINTDKEFAAFALENGNAEAFKVYADSNAIMLPEGDQPIIGKAKITEAMAGSNRSIIEWAPDGVEVAGSGDLGYTWGMVVISRKDEDGNFAKSHGKYLSVWKKQQDGSWKYIMDMGNSNPAPLSYLKDTRVKFDPKADPEADLMQAIQTAKKENKRILMDVGGEWCIWCQKMDIFIKRNPELNAFLNNNFVMLKVNYSPENKNTQFLSRYPQVAGYPHIFILEKDGKFLHSQNTADLERLKSYDKQVYMEFLKKWSL